MMSLERWRSLQISKRASAKKREAMQAFTASAPPTPALVQPKKRRKQKNRPSKILALREPGRSQLMNCKFLDGWTKVTQRENHLIFKIATHEKAISQQWGAQRSTLQV